MGTTAPSHVGRTGKPAKIETDPKNSEAPRLLAPVVGPLPFERRAACAKCLLHTGCKSPGIPTRQYAPCESVQVANGGPTLRLWHEPVGVTKSTALLLIGKGPASDEDRTGHFFTGATGIYADRIYVEYFGLQNYADVYYSNAVRCQIPKAAIQTKSLKACSEYLYADIDILFRHYSAVVLLLCGGEACETILHCSLEDALYQQGDEIQLGNHRCRVFVTYNPAMLLPSKKALKTRAIETHLEYCWDYLANGKHWKPLQCEPVNTSEIVSTAARYALDIETYGLFDWFPAQKDETTGRGIFQYRLAPDTIEHKIVSIATAFYRDDKLVSAVVPTDQRGIEFAVPPVHSEVVGSNLLFDCSWMREEWGLEFWQDFSTNTFIDTMVLSFLDDEERPEKSLKTLTKLFRLADYSGAKDLKKGERYSAAEKAQAYSYNALDAKASLVLADMLIKRLDKRFGPSKLATARWYSDVIKLCLDLHHNGTTYSKQRLQKLESQCNHVSRAIIANLASKYNLVAGGKGSDESTRDFFARCFAVCKEQPKLTKTGKVCTDAETVKLLLEKLPHGCAEYYAFKQYEKLQTTDKLLTSYVRPLLTHQTRELQPGQLTAWPRWHCVPVSQEWKGGTRQARLSAANPSRQNPPDEIIATECSRWGDQGILLTYDYDQLEYRCAGLLSGDEAILDIFRNGRDIHGETGKVIAKALGIAYTKMVRFVGKTINFLLLFRGGIEKARHTIYKYLGKTISTSALKGLQDAIYTQYSALINWQDKLVAECTATGLVHLLVPPHIHLTRSFIGGELMTDKVISGICNFPVQAFAALLNLSAQIEIQQELAASDLADLCKITNSKHDSGTWDCHQSIRNDFEALASRILPKPRLLADYQAHYARTCPLSVKLETQQ